MSDLKRLVVCWSVALLFGGVALQVAAADPQSLRFHEVNAADGTPLNVVETGNVDAPALLLLHGFSQSYLSFHPQLHDPDLTERFRVVAFDLRGHGGSGKPWLREAYAGHRPWADDVHRVWWICGHGLHS
jgi:pimeloyl-ACP methyl ester carboxylesterase